MSMYIHGLFTGLAAGGVCWDRPRLWFWVGMFLANAALDAHRLGWLVMP